MGRWNLAPWEPKGRYVPQIGDEVTVDLGECPQIMLSHGTQEQGVRGLVAHIDEEDRYPHPDGHPILVWYRRPLPVKGRSGYYSAWELRPFDALADLKGMQRER